MALVFAGRCVRSHRARDTGDWARRVAVGDSQRHDRNPGDEVAAGFGRGPHGRSETHWRSWPPPAAGQRLCPGRAAAEPGTLLSLTLTVPQLHRSQRTPGLPGTSSPSVAFPPESEPCCGGTALKDTQPQRMHSKGPGSRLSCPALASQRRKDTCHHGLWSFRTCKWLIVTNTPASLQDGHFVTKILHQCRTYGHFKEGRYSSRNNGPPFLWSSTVYYDILQISPNATQSQIKSAYYKQSLLYHPDKNAGSEEAALRFTQINEAYSVLGSVSLRKKYDRGILTPADLQSGKKPLEKAQASKTKQSQAWSSSEKSQNGKSAFNFDEFYRAHYGEQLAREQTLRWRRMQLRSNKKSLDRRWHFHKLVEAAVTVMLMAGFFLLFSIKNK